MLGMALSWTSWRHGMKQVVKLRNLSSQSLTLPCSYLTFASDLIDCSISSSCLRYDFLLKDFQYPKRVRSGPTPPDYPPPGKSVRTRFGSDGGAEPPPPPPPPGPPPAKAKAAVASRSGPSQSFLEVVRPQASVVVMVPRVCLTFLMKPHMKSCLLIDLFAVQCSTWLLQVD